MDEKQLTLDECNYCNKEPTTTFHKLGLSGQLMFIDCCDKCAMKFKGVLNKQGYEQIDLEERGSMAELLEGDE
jgi:hypothetical protein